MSIFESVTRKFEFVTRKFEFFTRETALSHLKKNYQLESNQIGAVMYQYYIASGIDNDLAKIQSMRASGVRFSSVCDEPEYDEKRFIEACVLAGLEIDEIKKSLTPASKSEKTQRTQNEPANATTSAAKNAPDAAQSEPSAAADSQLQHKSY